MRDQDLPANFAPETGKTVAQGGLSEDALSLFEWADGRAKRRRDEVAGVSAGGATVHTLYPPAEARFRAPPRSEADSDWPEVPREREEDDLISLFDSDDLITAEEATTELRRSIERMQTEDRKAANEAEALLDGLARILEMERARLDQRARDLEPPLVLGAADGR
jgi:hypothetical protein